MRIKNKKFPILLRYLLPHLWQWFSFHTHYLHCVLPLCERRLLMQCLSILGWWGTQLAYAWMPSMNFLGLYPDITFVYFLLACGILVNVQDFADPARFLSQAFNFLLPHTRYLVLLNGFLLFGTFKYFYPCNSLRWWQTLSLKNCV